MEEETAAGKVEAAQVVAAMAVVVKVAATVAEESVAVGSAAAAMGVEAMAAAGWAVAVKVEEAMGSAVMAAAEGWWRPYGGIEGGGGEAVAETAAGRQRWGRWRWW